MYHDFNDTSGLVFVGSAATSSCDDGGPYDYQPRHGINDAVDVGNSIPPIQVRSASLQRPPHSLAHLSCRLLLFHSLKTRCT